MRSENKELPTLLLENFTECKILKENADETNRILDCIGDLLFVIDRNRVIVKVNKSTCDMFKKKPGELIGKHCYEVVHGTKAAWCNCPATKTFESKQTVTEEVNDPNLGVPLLVTTSPILDDQGEVAQVIHIAKDITKMKLAETELHIAANLFGTASDSILVHDLDGRIVYFNESAYKTRGYTEEEFQALTVEDIEVPGSPRFFGDRMKELVEKGEATFEAVNLCKDKKVVAVEIHAQVIESDGRKLILSVARDISKRKAAEQELADSQAKYQTTFEASMDALMLASEQSFLDCNNETLRLFGLHSVEEFTKFHPADLSPPTQPDGTPSMNAAISHMQKAFQRGTDHFFWIHKRADGTTFPADVLLTRMPLKGKQVLQATVRDITEQKKAEQSLVESEEKFRILAEESPNMIFINQLGRVLYVNKKLEEISGYTRKEILSPDFNFLILFSPEYLETLKLNHAKQMRGENLPPFEQVFVTRTGKRINVIITTKLIMYKGKQALFGILTDITEHIEFEKKLNESQSRIELMNEKLRVVGGLTRHDVRNKLSAVTGYAYILKKKHSDQADVVEGLSKMEQAVAETVKIFDFARMYEQIGAEELTYINVEEKLKEAVALFSGPLPTIINGCRGLTVLADSFLRQLFYNFIDNTRKYGKKTTTIRVYYEKADPESLKLVYEDDGVGIPLESKPHLFKEGFSTGGSTGFGLFLTKRMIDVYGWKIEENGKPGEGAKFSVTIPKLGRNEIENYQLAS